MDIDKIINNNSINYIGNLILNNYEIYILDKYNINYKKCNDMKDLIFTLQEYIMNYNIEEIEDILISISERDYYNNTNK